VGHTTMRGHLQEVARQGLIGEARIAMMRSARACIDDSRLRGRHETTPR
jgi:hypothetical protein